MIFQLEVRNSGGHSSVPRKDNAIYRLADGLARLAKFDFPVHLNDTTRVFFERSAQFETGQMAADMHALSPPTSPIPLPSPVSRQQSRLQRAAPHHLRRDDAAGRSRRERAAAACDAPRSIAG